MKLRTCLTIIAAFAFILAVLLVYSIVTYQRLDLRVVEVVSAPEILRSLEKWTDDNLKDKTHLKKLTPLPDNFVNSMNELGLKSFTPFTTEDGNKIWLTIGVAGGIGERSLIELDIDKENILRYLDDSGTYAVHKISDKIVVCQLASR